MDPGTAFQLVCGALQLIEYGVATAKVCYEIHHSASSLSSAYEELDYDTGLLSSATSALKGDLSIVKDKNVSLTPDQLRLRRVATECDDLAKDLVNHVDRLKYTKQKRKRNVPKQCLRLARSKSKIEKLQDQLRSRQKILDKEMLIKLWSVEHFEL